MRLTLRTALTATALAALLAAGCGSKPEPVKPKPPVSPVKSEAPPLPVPPRPAEIAWGEAVNGLKIGLVPLGSGEGAAAEQWQNWECKGCRCADRLGVEKCGVCGRQGHFLAHCDSCTARYRLCVGCREVKPRSPVFQEAGPFFFEAHLSNEGKADLWTMMALGEVRLSACSWRFRFVPATGGPSWTAEQEPASAVASPVKWPPSVHVAAGGQNMTVIAVGTGWHFVSPGREPAKSLAPGKYTVTATYAHPDHSQDQPCRFWHGTVTTGPVGIEIKAGAAAAPLREEQIVAKALAIGRQRWREQAGDAPAGMAPFGEKPVVTRSGQNWTVVFETTPPEIAGARATVIVDAYGREVSTHCAWSLR